MAKRLFGSSYVSDSTPIMKRAGADDFVDFKRRVVQGDVTINLRVNDNDPAERTKWAQQLKDHARMGGFHGKHQVHILPGDLLFTLNSRKRIGNVSVPIEQREAAFSSFNGFPLMGARNRSEYQSFFKFVGIAKTSYRHAELTQPANGMASQFKGATSIGNTSVHTFSPGDKVAALVPPVDPVLRKRELQESASMRSAPKDRLIARPHLVTPRDIMDLPRQSTQWLFRKNRNKKQVDHDASIRRLHSSQIHNLSAKEAFAISEKLNVLQIAFNAVAVLDAYGLITLNFPQSTTQKAYDSLNKLLSRSVLDLLGSGRPLVVVTGDRARVNGEESRAGQNQTTKENQLLWLAQQLDLVHDTARSQESLRLASQSLQDALVAVSNNTSFKSDNHARMFDIRRFLNPSVRPETLGAVRTGQYFDRQNYDKQLAKRQADRVEHYYQNAMSALDEVESTIAGTALNHSKPGQPLDIVL